MDLSQFSRVIQFDSLPDPSDTWELKEKIGEGTFGAVYRATHVKKGEEIAVKVLDNVHEVVEEVEEEYKILRDLGSHPNLPAFHGLYLKNLDPPAKPQLWIAMELCRGGSVTELVKSHLKKSGPLPELLLAHMVKETLKALQHLHSNHVMHRDVKGHNILLTSDAKVKLIDFGVSGHLDNSVSRRHTSVGTPYWMSPEVIACEQQLDYTYDVRCDVWSMGITTIELADGEPPYAELHPMKALFKIPRSPPPTLKHPSKWSDKMKDFISSCLVKDFEKRPFIKELLNHPFITQVADNDSQVQQELESLMVDSCHMMQEPYITAKDGKIRKGQGHSEGPGNNDLATLETLDEDTIVNALQERYASNEIYTYIGDILLAVNPFRPLNIYTTQWSSLYVNSEKRDNPPHIYAVADHAYQEMMHHQHNQCIVISGESGAGKTESANFLVQQLTSLGKAANRNLEERILLVNPLVEAFGNAATVINDNSSRFGKYLEMSFTPSGKVTGATMTEYLLEKSRVVHQLSGERNFHVFYYIYDGLSQEDRLGKYHLQETTKYRYLNGCNTESQAAHRAKFKTVQKCFEVIGFKSQEVSSVYSILAAILHLGNVDFTEAESQHDTRTNVEDTDLTQVVAELLGIDTKELSDSLTSSGMVARGETIVRHHSVTESTNVRDAMAKALYGRLFSWIVNKINQLLKPSRQQGYGDERNAIGILDIFGFENFEHNSFEQLCINIANEQIQYYFNQHIFMWEQKEYESEGLNIENVNFTDNQSVLELLLARPLGLLALLDEESNFPRATDTSLVEKFAANLPKDHLSKPKSNGMLFTIQHYAGPVTYDADGMLEKNRDRLALEVTSLLRTSQVALVRTLFNAQITKTGNLQGSQSSNSSHTEVTQSSWSIRSASNSSTMSQSRLQQTVATYFRYSLMDLLSKLVTGTPHFVRCIRPNTENSPGFYDREKVMIQLRYTGVLETTRIRRQGYPHRLTFFEFVKRYRALACKHTEELEPTAPSCVLILGRLGLKDYAVGKTKVFLKYYHQEELCRRFAAEQKRVIQAQAWCRMWLQRRRFYKLVSQRQDAAKYIQKMTRGWFVRKEYNNMCDKRKAAAISIQKGYRGYKTRKRYRPVIRKRHEASVKVQAMYRGHMQRKRFRSMQDERDKCATNIQAAFRGHIMRKEMKKKKEERVKEDWAATILQKNFKMWKTQADYTNKQLQKEMADAERVKFSKQVDVNGVKVYHNQMISMERESSDEEQTWSEERNDSYKRITEKKQVWGGSEKDYYYGMQKPSIGKALWAKQRDKFRQLGTTEGQMKLHLQNLLSKNGYHVDNKDKYGNKETAERHVSQRDIIILPVINSVKEPLKEIQSNTRESSPWMEMKNDRHNLSNKNHPNTRTHSGSKMCKQCKESKSHEKDKLPNGLKLPHRDTNNENRVVTPIEAMKNGYMPENSLSQTHEKSQKQEKKYCNGNINAIKSKFDTSKNIENKNNSNCTPSSSGWNRISKASAQDSKSTCVNKQLLKPNISSSNLTAIHNSPRILPSPYSPRPFTSRIMYSPKLGISSYKQTYGTPIPVIPSALHGQRKSYQVQMDSSQKLMHNNSFKIVKPIDSNEVPPPLSPRKTGVRNVYQRRKPPVPEKPEHISYVSTTQTFNLIRNNGNSVVHKSETVPPVPEKPLHLRTSHHVNGKDIPHSRQWDSTDNTNYSKIFVDKLQNNSRRENYTQLYVKTDDSLLNKVDFHNKCANDAKVIHFSSNEPSSGQSKTSHVTIVTNCDAKSSAMSNTIKDLNHSIDDGITNGTSNKKLRNKDLNSTSDHVLDYNRKKSDQKVVQNINNYNVSKITVNGNMAFYYGNTSNKLQTKNSNIQKNNLTENNNNHFEKKLTSNVSVKTDLTSVTDNKKDPKKPNSTAELTTLQSHGFGNTTPNISSQAQTTTEQSNGGVNTINEQHQRQLQEIDDMFNDVLDLYTTVYNTTNGTDRLSSKDNLAAQWRQVNLKKSDSISSQASWDTALQQSKELSNGSESPGSPIMERDAPTQRDDIKRDESHEQIQTSLELQQKTSFPVRYKHEERRAQREAVRGPAPPHPLITQESRELIQRAQKHNGNEDQNPTYNFRAVLKKTDGQSPVTSPTDGATVQQVDFRSILKKRDSEQQPPQRQQLAF